MKGMRRMGRQLRVVMSCSICREITAHVGEHFASEFDVLSFTFGRKVLVQSFYCGLDSPAWCP